MYKINFGEPIHVHFIGIGGISMSGLADILFSKGFIYAETGVEEHFSTIENISIAYLKSFGYDEEDESKTPLQVARERQKSINFSTVKPPLMDDITLRKTIFDIFNNSNALKSYISDNSKILNKFVWNDLKLFCGTSSDLRYNLISRLDNSKTTLGECALAILLATPTDDISELMDRQDIIEHCLDNETLVKNFNHYLDLFKNIEQNFLSFWSKTDPIYNQAYQYFLLNKFYFKNKNWNKKTLLLEGKKRIFGDFSFLGSILMPFSFTFYTNAKGNGFWENFIWSVTHGSCTIFGAFDNLLMQYPAQMDGLSYLNIPMGLIQFFFFYNAIERFKDDKNLLKNIAFRLNDVKTFLYIITKIENEVAINPDLNKNFGNKLDGIRKLISLSQSGKTEFGRSLKTLKELPLYDMNYFFNNTGKLLACFQIFIENKNLFCDAIYELGQVDAFLSTANLIRKSTLYNDDHTYVFAKYLNKVMSKNTPYLKARDLWNPFLDARIAIGNEIEFGDTSSTNLKTMILTGPNAGGKSTYIVGLEINILLSQVFGIAAADEFILTPFSKINSYIEVRDDISAGKSLFMAEVDRVQKHIDILDTLKPNEFAFTIFDEPFRGTNPYEGAAVEYSVLEALSNYKNCLNIVATHYPMIMLLEEKKHERGFRNYKVFISRDPKTKDIIYHYKIVPGRATQSIAIDILEKYGYDKKLLQRARDILENPGKYDASF